MVRPSNLYFEELTDRMNPPLGPGSLCIRADAGERMGLGHMMRCLALAQAWKVRGGQVKLLSHPVVPSLDRRIEEEGFDLHHLEKACGSLDEASEVASLASRYKADWLVLDGYHFTPAYRAALKGARRRLLIVDDLADTDVSAADIILNQNVYAEPSMYSLTRRLLLGNEYALLRREFLPWRGMRPPEPNDARRVLILLGGSDPDNVTLRVLQMLGSMVTTRRLELTVVVGAANPHAEILRAFLAASRCNAILLVDPPNLPELMTHSHIAISAAGSSCWELACLGLPMLLITTAPNQRRIATRLEEMGLAVSLGWHEDFPPTDAQARLANLLDDRRRRRRVSEQGRLLVDGGGAGRAVDAMLGLTAHSGQGNA